MTLRLRKDLVLVEPFEPPSRIILPDDALHETRLGTVLNRGAEVDGITPGQTIAFPRAVGETTYLDGKQLLVMRDSDVLAVV